MGAKRLSKLCLGRNVFLKFALVAKCLSEIWLDCENMNAGAKRLAYVGYK